MAATRIYIKPGWTGCKKAREFLGARNVDLQERDLFKDRLTAEEITDLAKRAGGIEALVAPTRRAEVEGMSSGEILHYLLEDPSRLRRPIIDTGDTLYVGFTKSVQAALERLTG